MSDHGVRFKGVKSYLIMSLDWEEPFPSLLSQLESQLKEADNFFDGSKVVLEVSGKEVVLENLQKLQHLLAQHGMELWGVRASHEDDPNQADSPGELSIVGERYGDGKMTGHGKRRPRIVHSPSTVATVDNKVPPKGLVVKRTLRSGQVLNFPGSIVLIGDVNPGAEIIAGHDIVVWGSLKGTACAGASGNSGAAIYALHMAPSQLRIADHLSRSPKENPVLSDGHDLLPEVAHIEGDEIVVERWDVKKNRIKGEQ